MKTILKTLTALGALLVLTVPLLVSESMLFPYITGKNFTFRILVECTAAVWLLVCLYDVSFRPRASLILWSFLSFLAVLFVADLTGVDPVRSFWSNFERMEGFVTIVHFFVYFLILASLFKEGVVYVFGEKVLFLEAFLWTSVAVATAVGISALQQIGDMDGSNWRVTGTTGNAAYMALYMLFSVFMALTLSIRTRVPWRRNVLLVLAAFFAFMLLQTATRGVVIGLGVSGFVTAFYLAIFWSGAQKVRTLALSATIAVALLASALWVFHDTAFIQDNRMLARATNINLSELTVRMTVWEVALEGVKERPVFGWGQDNFPIVFAKYYDPSLANQEPWFDRAHNVFLDWLVAGGVLGLLAYLALFASAAWYVLFSRTAAGKAHFSVVEQALLFGISAGYFVQNLVVFDTLISYVYFAAILAYIHARVGQEWWLTKATVLATEKVSTVALPLVVMATVVVVYVTNVPLMTAASRVIDGIRAESLSEQTTAFTEAFHASEAGKPEVLRMASERVRQFVANAAVASSTKVTLVETIDALARTRTYNKELSAQEYTALHNFYIAVDGERSLEYAKKARSLGEQKVDLIINEGIAYYIIGDKESAATLWREAYELYKEGRSAEKFYAIVLLLEGRSDEIESTISPRTFSDLSTDQFVESVAHQENANNFLKTLYQMRITDSEAAERTYINLAMLYYNEGETEEAIATLVAAQSAFPQLQEALACAIRNVEANVPINNACE